MDGEEAVELPEPLREWVTARAAETGRSPSEVLARAAAAYRLLDEHETLLPQPDAEELSTLESRVADLETEVDEKIQDVRERVIQVKREADEKASADHDHPELRTEMEAVASEANSATDSAEAALAETESVRETVEALEASVDGGFDNYESILRGLKEGTDDVRSRTDRLVSAITRLRDRLAELEAADDRRAAAETLQHEATQKGVTDAVCGTCESTVYLGLLADARCPHCEAPYEGVDTDTGFFRPARLVVADRPALEESRDAVERSADGPTDHTDPGAAARREVGNDDPAEPADVETLFSDPAEDGVNDRD
ncbi:CopG family transcriptional regulator [Halobaculum sp. MBLA0143]|uniref:CopG family transcriptional regulator n=1 Tax=Halobaculum sp. MBLA0143 TaxID=3079933 RepID=UPI003523D467